ncbi:MAG: glycoside hydrolase family 3 C-terminal domain-containing protein, partial [Ignavibacteriaceae bacterium]
MTLIFTCSLYAQESNNPGYLNLQLSIEERVDDLVSRMTLEEKASQMIDNARAIPRLKIPEYGWWNEALHGVGRAGVATVFPQAIGLAATWNSDLMFTIADVISTEARAKHHEFARNNDFSRYKGLTFWSPNINIFRDPRWGRGQETYGEDPFLTARMGIAFVNGLQGNDPKYFKVIATAKHYAVHSGPEPERHTFDAVADDRDLYDTYLPAFESLVKEAKVYSVMCAYNRYMGDACCGSDKLLQKILREDWNFDGYIVSDCWAIDDIFKHHKIVKTGFEATAISVKSGTDLECGNLYDTTIVNAVKHGLLTEEEVDISLKRLFTARFKLGMFDPPEMVKYTQIPYSENDSEEHRKLSVKAAQESIVLLKNENNTLPLKKDIKKIAVIGPTADSYQMLLGNYNGTPSKYVTPLQGLLNKAGENTEIVYEAGCNLVEEGAVIHNLTSDILSAETGHVDAGWRSGLSAEYFRNTNLEGEPFFTKIDQLDSPNWIYGTRIPNLWMEPEYSIRWSGFIIPPSAGNYNFTVKGNDGYRLYVDDKLVVEDWTKHAGITEKSNHIELEEGKTYNIKVEYFRAQDSTFEMPHLSIQWELMDVDNSEEAIKLATSSDLVIFVGGITPQLEGEEMRVDFEGFRGGDRTSLDMPKVQENLLKLVAAAGKPVILVLTGGSALSVNWANENIPAIVNIWYPGQEGGTALADVLFGDYNPAGRLPVTFYKSVEQLPPFEDYNMKGRTYRYFEGEPLYPFGYGLSYTTFSYSNLQIGDETKAGENISVSVDVENTGQAAGDEVVQLYIKHTGTSLKAPIHSLQEFTRVHLKPGEKKTVNFVLTPKQLSLINNEIERVVEPVLV